MRVLMNFNARMDILDVVFRTQSISSASAMDLSTTLPVSRMSILPSLMGTGSEGACVNTTEGIIAQIDAAGSDFVHITLCPETKDTPLQLDETVLLSTMGFNVSIGCSEFAPTSTSTARLRSSVGVSRSNSASMSATTPRVSYRPNVVPPLGSFRPGTGIDDIIDSIDDFLNGNIGNIGNNNGNQNKKKKKKNKKKKKKNKKKKKKNRRRPPPPMMSPPPPPSPPPPSPPPPLPPPPSPPPPSPPPPSPPPPSPPPPVVDNRACLVERSGEGSFLVDAMGGVNELSISGLNFTDLNGMSGMATSVPLIGSTVGAFGSGSTVVIDSCDFRNFVNGTLFLESFVSDGITDPSVLDVRSSVFDSNSVRATFLAGAITVGHGENSDLRFVDSTLRNNTSLGNGGAVRIEEADTVLIDSCVIEMNEALNGGSGGGVFLGNVTQTLEVRDSLFSENLANGRAGAFGIAAGLASVSILGTDFLDNFAGSDGGAVALIGSNGTLVVGLSSSRNTRFIRNTSNFNAGAINVQNFVNVDFRDVDLRNNTSAFFGGAIQLLNVSGDTNITDCNFEQNQSLQSQSNVAVGTGGGIRGTNLGALNVIRSVFRENFVEADQLSTSDGGGAIAVVTVNSTSLTDSLFISNRVTGRNGGAVALANVTTTVVVDSCNFEDNQAGGADGGALSVDAAGAVQIDRSTFTRNSASTEGGAVSVDTLTGFISAFRIVESNFTDNTSNGGAGGGAVYITDILSDATIIGGRFVGNTAASEGGAILVANSPSADFLVFVPGTMEQTFFFNNTAEDGGAIAAINIGLLSVLRANFTANTANTNGGQGGAIEALEAGTFTVANVEFIRNEAFTGPAIQAEDTSGMAIFSGLGAGSENVFQGNVAGDSGDDVVLVGYTISP